MRGLSRLLLVFSIFFISSIEISAFKTHIIYWNASNPLFNITGGYEINVRLGDQIKIICPHLRSMEDDDKAYLIIQKDSEMSYLNCVLEGPRQVAVCNNPAEIVSSTTTVRKYRMNHFGIEMEPGMTHYFMSTSGGSKNVSEMNKRMGGVCMYDNMRMKIVVDELDPSTVVDTTRFHPTTMPSPPSPPSHSFLPSVSPFSVPVKGGRKILHEQRRHTKKEHEMTNMDGMYSESDLRGVYDIHDIITTSEETTDIYPPSGWDSMKPNADEMVGDVRAYVGSPDYIISEHSSSATFSLILLCILLLISLR